MAADWPVLARGRTRRPMSGEFSSLCLSVVRSDVCVWASVVVVGCSIPKNCAPVCENRDIHSQGAFSSTWKTSKWVHESAVACLQPGVGGSLGRLSVIF